MMNRLKHFKTLAKEFNAKHNGVLFWTVVVEILLFTFSHDMWVKGYPNISLMMIVLASGLLCLVAYKVAKFSANFFQDPIANYSKSIAEIEDKTKQLMNPETYDNIPSILFVSNNKVYEIPRPELDQWAKSNPDLRTKLEKIVNNHSLRSIMNFHLLPEDRQALNMHVLMDMGDEVYENVYPVAINQALKSMGDAFEKYRRRDLNLKDLEGNPDMSYIQGDTNGS